MTIVMAINRHMGDKQTIHSFRSGCLIIVQCKVLLLVSGTGSTGVYLHSCYMTIQLLAALIYFREGAGRERERDTRVN